MMKALDTFDVFSLTIITTAALAGILLNILFTNPIEFWSLTLIFIDDTQTPLVNEGAGMWVSEEPRVLVPRLPKGRVDFLCFVHSLIYILFYFIFLPY